MKKTDLPANTLSRDPHLAPGVFIARGAMVMGDVDLGENVSIWYNAVVRGDVNAIRIAARSNIQDGAIIHLTNSHPCIVEEDVTVGHHVNLHGCHIESGCLIGIGAIILTGAHIKRGSIIGAGAVVKENTVVEPGSLMVGIPARRVRELTEDTYQENLQWAAKYVKLAKRHKEKYGSAECL